MIKPSRKRKVSLIIKLHLNVLFILIIFPLDFKLIFLHFSKTQYEN